MPITIEKIPFAPLDTFKIIYIRPVKEHFWKYWQIKLVVGMVIMVVILLSIWVGKILFFDEISS